MDEAKQDAESSLPTPFVSVAAHYPPLPPPTCPIIQGRLYRRRALPREGSGVTSTRRHKGECGRRLVHRQTERSDGPMMYSQTVAEEVRHSGIREAGRQEDRKRRAVRHLPGMTRTDPSTTGTGGQSSPTMVHSYGNHI